VAALDFAAGVAHIALPAYESSHGDKGDPS